MGWKMVDLEWNDGTIKRMRMSERRRAVVVESGEMCSIAEQLYVAVDGINGGLGTKNDAIQLHHWNKTAKGNKTRMIAIIHRLKWTNCLGRMMCELPPILCVCFCC